MPQYSCKLSDEEPAVQASEILAALQELYNNGLDGQDNLEAAIRNLSQGNGHRFRSPLSLPKELEEGGLVDDGD
jgi:hypothetical protein